MIARLAGRLAEKQPDQVILDVGGVGYRVFIPFSTFSALPAVDQPVILLTLTHVREDLFHLYGFLTPEERDLFSLLTSVTRVGPKLALAALSTLSPASILNALSREDITTLSRIPGVGKKSAQRLVIELKDKVGSLGLLHAGTPGGGAPTASPAGTLRAELASALVNLGYKRPQVEAALDQVLTPSVTRLEEGLRLALKELAG
ncbi:MAG: Holliday junction branch migration protein RuvA [Magnetococcales bacterium]|nr:Holliday junction branch migration protein RuvA [Magnetococcales bacterium]